MNVGHPYDKMDLRLFYFDVAICDPTTLEAEFRHSEDSIPEECNRSSIDQGVLKTLLNNLTSF